MRRKKEKTNNFFLIVILLLLVVGVSYAYLSTSLNITGEVTGNFVNNDYIVDPSGNPKLNMDKPIISKWQEGNTYKYQHRFNINNTSNINYDNFSVSLTFNHKITSVNIWNYDYKINGKTVIITNNKYNLDSNKSLEVNFILGTKAKDLKLIKVKLEANEELDEIGPNNFVVEFKKTSTWGNYVHQYSVTVTNKADSTITYWQINVSLPEETSYLNGWNAIFGQDEDMLTIKNESYNGRIEKNKSVTFGLQLQTDIKDFNPTNYKIMVR